LASAGSSSNFFLPAGFLLSSLMINLGHALISASCSVIPDKVRNPGFLATPEMTGLHSSIL
jgi:hypothetical protein